MVGDDHKRRISRLLRENVQEQGFRMMVMLFLCVDEKEVCERVNESACNRSHRTIGI